MIRYNCSGRVIIGCGGYVQYHVGTDNWCIVVHDSRCTMKRGMVSGSGGSRILVGYSCGIGGSMGVSSGGEDH